MLDLGPAPSMPKDLPDHTLQFRHPRQYSGFKSTLLCIVVSLVLCPASLQAIGGGVWEPLEMAPGFIAEYQTQIEGLDHDDLDELHGALETLFSHCQCLPNSKFEGGSVLWEVRKGDVVLLGNPRFYKLVSIGNAGRQHQTRCAPTHTGKVSLQVALLQLTGLSNKQARTTLNLQKTLTQAAAAKKKRSARARNRRVPPTRKKQSGSVVNLDDEVEATVSNDEDQGEPTDEDDDQQLDITMDDVCLGSENSSDAED
jgi:hypothetical protein